MQLISNSLAQVYGCLATCRICAIETNADAFGSTWVFVETPEGVIHVPASFVSSTRTPIDGHGVVPPRFVLTGHELRGER